MTMAPQRDDSGCAALVARIAELIGAFDLFEQHDTMSIQVVFQDGRVMVVEVCVRSFPAAHRHDPSLSASSNEVRELDNTVATRKYGSPLSASSNEVRELVNQATARRGLGPMEYGDVTFHLKNGNLDWYTVTLKFRPDEEERVEIMCNA